VLIGTPRRFAVGRIRKINANDVSLISDPVIAMCGEFV